MKRQTCIICRKPLNGGIMINGKRICKCCEERLINSDMDTDFYNYYKNCIKNTIVQIALKGEESRCQNYHL
jgi:hypothetical protein